MCAQQARLVESPSKGLVFLSMAMETTELASHQTGVFSYLSTLLLLNELETVKVNIYCIIW